MAILARLHCCLGTVKLDVIYFVLFYFLKRTLFARIFNKKVLTLTFWCMITLLGPHSDYTKGFVN